MDVTQPKTLKEALKTKLTPKQLSLLPSSFDIVGDIVIFSDIPSLLEKKEKLIGETVLQQYKNVKVVLKKTKKYSGKFRTPKLKILAGERRKTTTYKENNIKLNLNVEKAYFSSRLAHERLRISKLVNPNESILVMFSGCSPYPCVIAKNSKPKEIYAIELNPTAHKFALENIKLNKLTNITLYNGDVKKIIPKLKKKFNRILMPLPRDAEDFLPVALKAAKKGTVIHLYNFAHENEFEDLKEKIKCKLKNKKYKLLDFVKCGQYAPRTYRVCLDMRLL